MDKDRGAGGGKTRTPRNHTPVKPYDGRKSLLGKVGDTVKDMLSPSWLVDIVASVKKGSPQKNNQGSSGDVNSLSEEVTPTRPPHPFQIPTTSETSSGYSNNMHLQPPPLPPPPRGDPTRNMTAHHHDNTVSFTINPQMPYHIYNGPPPPHHFNHFPAGADGSYIPGTPMPPAHPQSFGQPMPTAFYGPASMNQRQNMNPMMNGSDDQSEMSEFSVSTSGCSSIMPNPDRRDYQQEILLMNDSRLQQLGQDKLNSPPHDRKDPTSESNHKNGAASFLWSSRKTQQPPAKRKQASFNLAAFGKKQTPEAKNSIFGKSPYYPGKTTFGGASSIKHSKVSSASPYETTPGRLQVRAKPRQVTDSNANTSTTAKWILNTLEKMSTPLSDTKRIPTYDQQSRDVSLAMTPGTYRRKHLRNEMSYVSNGPPTQRLSTPSISQHEEHQPLISKRTSAALQETENTFSYNEASHTNRPTAAGPARSSGKMRKEKSSRHYSSKRPEDDEPEEVNLSTGFTLPVSNIPKFIFGSSAPKTTTTPPAPQTSMGSSATTAPSPFTFSSPIQHQAPCGATTSKFSPSADFQFSSPILMSGEEKPISSSATKQISSTTTNQNSSPPPSQMFTLGKVSTAPRPKAINDSATDESKTNSDNMFKSTPAAPPPSMASSGLSVSPALKAGSVMDILRGPSPSGVPVSPALKAGSVMDILGGAKKTDQQTTDKNKNSLSSLFKKDSGSWECGVCMISNKTEVSKCVACSAAKPDNKTQQAPKVTGGWGSEFSKPSSSWECSACMVTNKNIDNKCVACATNKPVSKTTTATTTPQVAITSSWGAAFSKPTGNWECSMCMVSNGGDKTKCVACDTAKPQSKAATTSSVDTTTQPVANQWGSLMSNKTAGSWDCDACMVQNKPETNKCLACETPRPGAAKVALPATGFGKQAGNKGGSWECDTCLVQNQDVSKCIACETPRPGTKPTTGFIGSGGFKFGSTGGFQLSTTSASAKAATFGSSDIKTTSSAPATGGFKLSSTADAPAKTTGGFGLPSSDTAAPSSGGFGLPSSSTAATSTGGFSLPTSSTAAKFTGGFGLPSTSTAAPSSGGFGLPSSSTADKPSVGFQLPSKLEAPGFKLGNTTSCTATSSPFGSKPETSSKSPPQLTTSKAISFGETSSINSPVTSSNTLKVSSGFAFGGKSETTPQVGNSDTSNNPSTLFAEQVTSLKQISSFPTSSVNTASTSLFGDTKSAALVAINKPATAAATAIFGDTKAASTSIVGDNKPVSSSAAATGGFSFPAVSSDPKASQIDSKAPTFSAGGGFSSGFKFGVAATSAATTSGALAPVFGTSAVAAAPGGMTSRARSTPGTTLASTGPAALGGGGGGGSDKKRSSDDSDAPSAKKGAFNFGASEQPNSGGGLFKFGQDNPPPQVAPSSNPFVFSAGTSAPLGSSTPLGTNTPAPSPFSVAAESKPAFGGFGNTAVATPGIISSMGRSASTPSFGNAAAASNLFNPAAATQQSPAFGAQQPASTQVAAGGFNFGGASSTAGTFTFGANSNTQKQPSGGGEMTAPSGFNAGGANQGGFNFSGSGQGQVANPMQQPVANNMFNPQPGVGSNPFNNVAAGSTSQRRPVKKAVRKLRGR